MSAAVGAEVAAFRIDAFDLREADIGARQGIARQFAVTLEGLMNRSDIAASEQHHRIGHFRSLPR